MTLTGVVAESVTLTVNVEVPAAPVEVPLMAPVVELSVRPAGRDPEASAKVFAPVPPVAAIVAPV